MKNKLDTIFYAVGLICMILICIDNIIDKNYIFSVISAFVGGINFSCLIYYISNKNK